MNTRLLTAKNKTLTVIQKEKIEIQVLEGSTIIIEKKRIIVHENKINVEKYEAPSLIQYQLEDNERYASTFSGILLSR